MIAVLRLVQIHHQVQANLHHLIRVPVQVNHLVLIAHQVYQNQYHQALYFQSPVVVILYRLALQVHQVHCHLMRLVKYLNTMN